MVGAVRADKQARAALHHFSKWYADAVENMTFGWYRCQLEDSPFSQARRLTPHALLYFLLLLFNATSNFETQCRVNETSVAS